ncbi:MAG TPA: TolC family protein [Puia sp.]
MDRAQKIRITYNLVVLLLPYWELIAQEKPDTLSIGTLQEVLSVAVKNNPGQEVYRQQVRQARYNYQAAQGYWYPAVSGSLSGQQNLSLAVTPVPGILVGQPGTTYYAQFGKRYAYNAGINVTQNLFDWPLTLQAAIGKSNILLVQAQQDAYIQTLKNQAANYYFSAWIARASLDISRTDLLYADSLVALAKQRLEEGTADVLAFNQASINYNNVQQNILQSRQLYDQGIENLKIILGVRPATVLVLAGRFDPDSLVTGAGGSVGADKNLQVYLRQEWITVLQRRQQKAAAYPILSLSGYFGDQQYRNDFGLSFANHSWSDYRYIGVNLSIPIFTGLTNFYKYRSSQVQQGIARLQYENALKQSLVNDQLLVKSFLNYQEMVRASRANFVLYGHDLLLNQQKYREGIVNMDVYCRAFEDYLLAENVYLNNLSQWLSTWGTILSRE